MPETPLTGIPYPSREKDPWYTDFVNSLKDVDEKVYASREDRNILIVGGGVFTFDAGTNSISWDETLILTAAMVGFRWLLEAGSATIEDGEFVYFDLARGPASNVTITASTAQVVPNTNQAWVLAFRLDNVVYFRGGKALSDGESAVLFAPTGSSIEVEEAGTSIGIRPILNFASGATVVDNPGQNRIDINITTATNLAVPGTAAEAIIVGSPVFTQNDGTGNKYYNAASNGTEPAFNVVGINLLAAAADGDPVSIAVAGEVAIPDAAWEGGSPPLLTSFVGKKVYLGEAGGLTMTEPTTLGAVSIRVGILTSKGVGTSKIMIQIGDGVGV